jgi:hypothetical protein
MKISTSSVCAERVPFCDGDTYVRAALILGVDEVLRSRLGDTMHKLHVAVLTAGGEQCQRLSIAFWEKGDGRAEFVRSLVAATCRIEFRAELYKSNRNYWLVEIDRLEAETAPDVGASPPARADRGTELLAAALLAFVEKALGISTAEAAVAIAERRVAASELLELVHAPTNGGSDGEPLDPEDIPFD